MKACWFGCAAALAIAAAPPTGLAQEAPKNVDWALLGGNSDVWHYSALREINEATVARLGLAWSVRIPSTDGLVGNPLVVDGLVFQSGPMGRVYANDVRTGKELWTFSPAMQFDSHLSTVAYWASHHNRGLAVLGDKVFVASGDCRLFALYRKTGKQAWVVQSCDPSKNYGITGAPRVGAGLVFIGNATGDYGMARGFVDAFDVESGRRVWRFYTVPGDPSKPFESAAMEMASRTWGKDYWQRTQGGGGWFTVGWNDFRFEARSPVYRHERSRPL